MDLQQIEELRNYCSQPAFLETLSDDTITSLTADLEEYKKMELIQHEDTYIQAKQVAEATLARIAQYKSELGV